MYEFDYYLYKEQMETKTKKSYLKDFLNSFFGSYFFKSNQNILPLLSSH